MTMKKDNFKIWMVRAGSGSFLIDEFLKEDIVAIGWNDIGSLDKTSSYEFLKEHINTVYGNEWSSGKLGQSASQIFRFLTELKIGDKVVTYDSNRRLYYRGEIISDYRYNDYLTYHHHRKVVWDEFPIGRDQLSIDSKNTLGSILTLFEIPSGVWEELVKAHPAFITDEEQEEIREIHQKFEEEQREQQLQELKEDVISRSNEFIKDLIVELDWHELEKLVAGILQAMGYKARLTGRGPDLGSDIIASPDGLEMTEPIIKVEVKHKIKSKDKIGAPDIRSFVGGLRNTTKGIYVSSTGFSKDAKMEAERANFQITLVDLDRLVELLIEYYETLDSESRALVPLKRIYWPV